MDKSRFSVPFFFSQWIRQGIDIFKIRMFLIENLDDMPRISLEQWQVFHAIVKEGSFAKAAFFNADLESSLSLAIDEIFPSDLLYIKYWVYLLKKIPILASICNTGFYPDRAIFYKALKLI